MQIMLHHFAILRMVQNISNNHGKHYVPMVHVIGRLVVNVMILYLKSMKRNIAFKQRGHNKNYSLVNIIDCGDEENANCIMYLSE